MNRDEACDLIERPRAVRMLVALLETPNDAPVSDLLEAVGGSRSTGLNRLEEFREAGLIEKRAGHNRTIYSLTDLGEEVTHHLVDGIDVIQEGNDDDC